MTFDIEQAEKDGKALTRDGREVVIYCTDAPGGWPIHGRISVTPRAWLANGQLWPRPGHESDLQNIPKVHEVWVNLYADRTVTIYHSRLSADAAPGGAVASAHRIACKRIEITEGEGLND